MNPRLGILGGGQLAMMLCEAARELKVNTVVLSPDELAPARNVCDQFICADYTNTTALAELAANADVVTLDNEHIPEACLLELGTKVAMYPQPQVMSQLRDRLTQRGLLAQLNIPQVRFWPVDTATTMRAAEREAAFPSVIKSRHGGYDGYGQQRVMHSHELAAAWDKLDQVPSVLEAWLDDITEFSIVGARDQHGAIAFYPAIANLHRDGQLVRSDLPAALDDAQVAEAQAIWQKVADTLAVRGVFTIEFFLQHGRSILVNEIAPRVHNSGHITQLAPGRCQFSAHVRGVMGMSLPELSDVPQGSMWNIYPQHDLHDPSVAEHYEQTLGGRIVLYGKDPKPRRKMGHWLVPEDQTSGVAKLIEKRGA